MRGGLFGARALAGAAFCSLLLAWPARAGEKASFQDVKVKPGDTLWGIAHEYLKDPSKWDELLKYNALPSTDPTTALPGMVLKVPVRLIRTEKLAARLVAKTNVVLDRPRDTADWRPAAMRMPLYQGDAIRTLESASARVKFLGIDLLNLDENSLAIIQPPKSDYEANLEKGSLFAVHSRVVTPSARITPKTPDTQYEASIREDLSTLVQVYSGVASVQAQGQSVDVPGGMFSEVPPGLAPGIPFKIKDMPALKAMADAAAGRAPNYNEDARSRAGEQGVPPALKNYGNAGAGNLQADVESMKVGMPVWGYRVQASGDKDFSRLLVNKVFESDERMSPADFNLSDGVYWWRIALIDLLGDQQGFSAPKRYSIGVPQAQGGVDVKNAVILIKPSGDETVHEDEYVVRGLLRFDGLKVSVNKAPVRVDDSGNFSARLKLKPGVNDVVVTVTDSDGSSDTETRLLIYR